MKEITINEIYLLILRKLEAIEEHLNNKQEEIKAYLARNSDIVKEVEVMLGLQSTRTLFELLRDEVEELHQVTVALFREETASFTLV
jgi:hypothetical protein